MSLRRTLFVTFGTLVLLGLLVAGVSIWATLQWRSTGEQLQRHYTRSLEAQRVQAATFRALKEVSDVILETDTNARQEFDQAISTVEEDLDMWARLAPTLGGDAARGAARPRHSSGTTGAGGTTRR